MHRIFISITLVLFTSSLYAGSGSCDFEKNLSDRDFYKKYSEELNIFYGAIGFNDFLVVKKGNRPLFCFEEKDFCGDRKLIYLMKKEMMENKRRDVPMHGVGDVGEFLPEIVSEVLINNFPCERKSEEIGDRPQ